MNKRNKTKGFTLIELLIVIAIIGILAGVVVVSLSGSTNTAVEASIKANLRSVDTVWKSDIIGKNDISASTDGLCDLDVVENIMRSVADDVHTLYGGDDNNTVASEGRGDVDTGTASDNKLWAQNQTPANTSAVGCFSSDDGWVVWARLLNDGGDAVYQCLDTSGFSGKQKGTVLNLATADPATPTCADSFS